MHTKKTSSAGGVILHNNHVVLVSQHGKTWSLPKGHLEKNETILETAYREIFEETGLSQLELVQPLGNYTRYKIGNNIKEDDQSEEKTLHFFLFKTSQYQLNSQDPDNPDVEWVPIENVEQKLTHPKDKEFFKSIKSTIYGYSNTCVKIETSFNSEKLAKKCSKILIEKKLAACCHIIPIKSCYYWENKVEEDSEYLCAIKTTQNNIESIEKEIKHNHPYDTPQFIVTPITYISVDYLNWIKHTLNLS